MALSSCLLRGEAGYMSATGIAIHTDTLRWGWVHTLDSLTRAGWTGKGSYRDSLMARLPSFSSEFKRQISREFLEDGRVCVNWCDVTACRAT
jgi:hypothetical protein